MGHNSWRSSSARAGLYYGDCDECGARARSQVELAAGTIRIDGRDIVGIGLRALRRGLTIIPQDPVMFTARLAIQPPRNCSSRTPGV